MDNCTIPLKHCSKCRRELPATIEYFHRHAQTPSGLRAWCKECRGSTFGVHQVRNMEPVSAGHRRCSHCLEEKPATVEYFKRESRRSSGLASWCKACHNEQTHDHYFADVETSRQRARVNAPKRAAKKRAYEKERYYADLEASRTRARENSREWRTRNPNAARDYRKANPQKCNAALRSWRRRNPEKVAVLRAIHRHRRQHRIAQTISDFTKEQWNACLAYWHSTCAYCGAQQSFWHPLEQDHVVPLTAGGGYTAANIVPACKSCNSSKSNRELQEWLLSRFGKHRTSAILELIALYIAQL